MQEELSFFLFLNLSYHIMFRIPNRLDMKNLQERTTVVYRNSIPNSKILIIEHLKS